jgi:CRISPR-associated endonuclease/helicase Cas3
MKQYFAHSLEGRPEDEWQTLEAHLCNTAELAGKFAHAFGAAEWGWLAGLWHDLGKCSEAFQKRLRGGPRVDHSTAGAKFAALRPNVAEAQLGKLLAYIIAGHHGGLPNGAADGQSGLKDRLNSNPPEYQACVPTLDEPLPTSLPFTFNEQRAGFQIAFFIRMIYSCLVDADFLDTEQFVDSEKARWREDYPKLEDLKGKLTSYLAELQSKADKAPINAIRSEILRSCQEKAAMEPGLFSLTVPTGGGKTLSSLAFAMKHAARYGMRRIIYVIPYTSIIDQNAEEFRKALGVNAVLEHHSNFEPQGKLPEDMAARHELAAENWDAPVIATTSVQFFESLFAAKPSRCRKLHNLASSVIILDEAQMIPLKYLQPCLEAIRELAAHYHASVVLCTATQPAVTNVDVDWGLPVREIMTDPKKLATAKEFQRVRAEYVGRLSNAELCDRLAAEPQVLCIVNSKADARNIYSELKARGVSSIHHLSTRMRPEHRKRKLEEIRRDLKEGKTCRVLSTQLIEAGVNLSAPVVYRTVAGIDSLAQAAGRCNRHGELRPKLGRLIIFLPESGLSHVPELKEAGEEGKQLLDAGREALSMETIREFFLNLYWRKRPIGLGAKFVDELNGGAYALSFPFQRQAAEFQFIKKNQHPVLTCPDKMLEKSIVTGLRYGVSPGKYLRQAQPWVVQVFDDELKTLNNTGKLDWIEEAGFGVLLDEDLYSEELGLLVESAEFNLDGEYF